MDKRNGNSCRSIYKSDSRFCSNHNANLPRSDNLTHCAVRHRRVREAPDVHRRFCYGERAVDVHHGAEVDRSRHALPMVRGVRKCFVRGAGGGVRVPLAPPPEHISQVEGGTYLNPFTMLRKQTKRPRTTERNTDTKNWQRKRDFVKRRGEGVDED